MDVLSKKMNPHLPSNKNKHTLLCSEYSILYIEDDKVDLFLLESNLNKIDAVNYIVDSAHTLLDAEKKLNESSNKYDLILLDIGLPDANGLEIIEYLHAKFSTIPIVVVSHNNDPDCISLALNKGAQDYLVKGHYSPEILIRTISYAVERMPHQKDLYSLAHLDFLTELPNRLSFNLYIENTINRANRFGTDISLLLLDFDRFKHINDAYGHHTGDTFLRTIASRLKKQLRSSDYIARLGGDEFVVVLEHEKNWIHGITTVIENLLKTLAEPVKLNHVDMSIASSCSIGIAKYCGKKDVFGADRLTQQADAAMYQAKKHGGNCYQHYNSTIQEAVLKRSDMIRSINKALDNKEFSLFYQPIVCAKTGLYTGVEALIRWKLQNDEVIHPIEFIQLLEETGKIIEVDKWALNQACEDFQHFVEAGILSNKDKMSVNVSPKQFFRQGFLNTVTEAISKNKIKASNLQLELTEDLPIKDIDHVIQSMLDLKSLGIVIAIDDFGTGYSSMAHLRDIPLDIIKIDSSFISNYLNSKADQSIVDAMIGLAKSLNKEVVIEGIEEKAVADCLIKKGCNFFQGFYYSKPLPLEAFLAQHKAKHSA